MLKFDEQLLNEFISDREKTLKGIDIEFNTPELLLLKNIPENSLKQTITSFEKKGIIQKTLFSWRKAASVLSLLLAVNSLTFSQVDEDDAQLFGGTRGVDAFFNYNETLHNPLDFDKFIIITPECRYDFMDNGQEIDIKVVDSETCLQLDTFIVEKPGVKELILVTKENKLKLYYYHNQQVKIHAKGYFSKSLTIDYYSSQEIELIPYK